MMMRTRITMLPGVLFTTAVAAVTMAQGTSLPPAERQSVETFLRDGAPAGAVRICDVAAYPSDGSRTILASLDYGGVTRCNWIVRLTTTPRLRPIGEIETVDVERLNDVIRDVDGDGTTELVIPRSFSTYEGGARCRAVVPIVYTCTANSCTKGPGTLFQSHYVAQLEERERRMSAPADADDDARTGRPVCLEIERDKLLRETGRNPRAGVAAADQWMRSADPIMRRKAVSVLADIGDADARQKLQTLSTDSDPATGDLARRALANR